MDLGLEALTRASANGRTEHRPDLFRLSHPEDRERLRDLLKREPCLRVHDELHSQLRELVRALNPSIRFTKTELDSAASGHLKGTPAEEYGVWVHYPWNGRLVHLLDEAEFVLVRTDRNRNKITREEQALLATKKVGVIGLSVGQSASLVLAQERAFGELRLADFDTLDLSNLNRIRNPVHLLGHNKAINTAREIAELDPFLKVVAFTEGITEANLELFLTEGGKLDLLVEECDSVAIKIRARQRAKALCIPVVMDTSDRGLIDVERFDLEPDRSILHGMVDHLNLEHAAKAVTNEEKLPFVVPIIGLDTMSTRMKASMLEIETTVTTWPQLASSVVLGGALVTHVARRILLDQPMPSGRWWLDPDDGFGLKEAELLERTKYSEDPVLSRNARALDEQAMLHMAQAAFLAPPSLFLTRSEVELLVSAGSQAPSGGNCQPWKFLLHEGRLYVFLDPERASSALDPGVRYAYLGMGACMENMLLQAARSSIPVEHSYKPDPGSPELVAVLSKTEHTANDLHSAENAELAEWISQRCTNRRNSVSMELSDQELLSLTSAFGTRFPLFPVSLLTERQQIEAIAKLCGRAERIRFLNPTCHHDMFVREMRWDQQQTESTRDGIDVATLELSLADRTGLRVAADPKAMSLLRHWGMGNVMEKMTAKNIRASSALAIFSIPDMTLHSAYTGGRVMERFWLKATSLGLIAHPVGAPIFMGLHGLWDQSGILSQSEHREAEEVLAELVNILGNSGAQPFFMLRLGKSAPPTARSLRLHLSEVLLSTKSEHA